MVNENKNRSSRILALDALRMVVMLIMFTRHAEIFLTPIVTPVEMWGLPMPDLKFWLPYWTRFLGHICSTGFLFSMGMGMVFYAESRLKRGESQSGIMRYFILRGVLLIVLQLTVANIIWDYTNPSRQSGSGSVIWLYFGILFALGSSLIINSVLIRFSEKTILFVAFLGFLFIHLFLPDFGDHDLNYPITLRLLFIPGRTGIVKVLSSVIPWFGITGVGIVFGKWFLKDRDMALKRALFGSIILIASFFVIRITGGFGNIRPYVGGDWRLLFFINKYPPGFSYVCITLGEVLLILWCFSKLERYIDKYFGHFLVFGRTALFFYLTHLYIFAFCGRVFFRDGLGLMGMYVVCLVILVILFPMCCLYNRFKSGRPINSVWRLF